MSGIQRCEDLTFCSSELSQMYLDLAQEFGDDDMNGDHADDATWILSASFIILTMQSGFGLLEMGSAVAGNEVNIMMKNAADVIFGSLSYYLLGYGISFGTPSIPFMGLGDFAPDGDNAESGLLYSRYIFQFSFAATATTIVSGMVAMRMKFFIYCFFSFIAIIAYAFPAHWIWASDGWLNTMGAYDFAGAGPVHLFGGVNGLVAIYLLGPRRGRFDGTRPKSDFRPVSQTSMLFGLFMLWWGWIGFNCGSTFGITGQKWIVATRAAITTVSGTGMGGAVSIAYSIYKTGGKMIKVEDVVNGILGSLVTSSASCSIIHTYESLLVGAVGALVALGSNKLVLRMRLDDVVGAAGVHAGAGIWGLISVGLFADGNLPGVDCSSGLFRGGGMRLLGLQLLLIVVITSWALMFSSIFFYFTGIAISGDWKNPRAGLRVSEEEEECGADAFLHGVVPFGHEEDDCSLSVSAIGSKMGEMNDIVSETFKNEEGTKTASKPLQVNDCSHTIENLSSEGEEAGRRYSTTKALPEGEVVAVLENAAPSSVEEIANAQLPTVFDDSGRPSNGERDDSFYDNLDIEASIQYTAEQVAPAGPRRSMSSPDPSNPGRRRSEAARDRRRSMMKAASRRKGRESMRVLM